MQFKIVIAALTVLVFLSDCEILTSDIHSRNPGKHSSQEDEINLNANDNTYFQQLKRWDKHSDEIDDLDLGENLITSVLRNRNKRDTSDSSEESSGHISKNNESTSFNETTDVDDGSGEIGLGFKPEEIFLATVPPLQNPMKPPENDTSGTDILTTNIVMRDGDTFVTSSLTEDDNLLVTTSQEQLNTEPIKLTTMIGNIKITDKIDNIEDNVNVASTLSDQQTSFLSIQTTVSDNAGTIQVTPVLQTTISNHADTVQDNPVFQTTLSKDVNTIHDISVLQTTMPDDADTVQDNSAFQTTMSDDADTVQDNSAFQTTMSDDDNTVQDNSAFQTTMSDDDDTVQNNSAFQTTMSDDDDDDDTVQSDRVLNISTAPSKQINTTDKTNSQSTTHYSNVQSTTSQNESVQYIRGSTTAFKKDVTKEFKDQNERYMGTTTTDRKHDIVANITKEVLIKRKTTTLSSRLPGLNLTTPADKQTKNPNSIEGMSVGVASTAWVPALIAAIVAGIIFFFVGYFSHSCIRQKCQSEPVTGEKSSHISGQRNGKESFHNMHTMELGAMAETTPLNNEGSSLLDNQMSTFKVAKRQSPIDIDSAAAVFEEKNTVGKLRFMSENIASYVISNTGTTLKVISAEDKSKLEGGPLGEKKYMLHHFHFHWGSENDKGSEHTVDKQAFVAEIHFVHWDSGTFNTFSDAAASTSKDALAVVAVLVKLGKEHNPLALITDNLSQMRYKGDDLELIESFNPKSLVPESCGDYWSYSGSLTTPPYTENVTWIVFKDPIEISAGQIEELRQLHSHEKDEAHADENKESLFISNNYRKVQELGRRIVHASFQ